MARVGPGHIKGAALRELFTWLRRELGSDRLTSIVDGLPHDDRVLFDLASPTLGMLAATWYRKEPVHALLDAFTAGLPRTERRRLAYDAAAASLSVTLGGVHKALLRVVGSPELHARFAQRLWDVHYSDGTVQVDRVGKTEVRVGYSSWTGHHPFICDANVASDLTIFPAMGLRNVTVEQDTCVEHGHDDCAHFVRWDG